MHLIIETFLLKAILLYCGLNSLPQSVEIPQPQNQYANDPCGDPTVESMAWEVVEGKVVEVIDGDTIVMSLDSKERLLVHLVGIDAPSLNQPFGRDAQRFLESMVRGKKIAAYVNPSNWGFTRPRPKEITGVIYLRGADEPDANLSLVRAGLARHKKSQPYTIARYTECQYERAEEQARAAKRGLWRVAG